MKKLLIILLLLTGCASDPYLALRMENQIDAWSDWVLQPEREWTPDEGEVRLHMQAGLEWDNYIDCPYIDAMLIGPWDQAFIGCSKRWGKGNDIQPYAKLSLMHQVDSRTSEFLQTDQRQWQGHNPFMHLQIGLDLYGMRCFINTGKSVFQGAPFEKEEHNPDLYWTTIGCGARFWGKTSGWD